MATAELLKLGRSSGNSALLFKEAPMKHFIDRIVHAKGYHLSHGLLHAGYFSFVFIEGHGTYALFGGVLVVFTIVSTLVGED
jgi:hypothetical protein